MIADLKGTIYDLVYRGWDDDSIKHFLTIENNYQWSEDSSEYLRKLRENLKTLEGNEV